ncbi:MAG: WD40 repeat domain-containing protein [Pirellulales bacterium]|nr:WD40 repeat domain-containing protein [Pirellulales bacterium]
MSICRTIRFRLVAWHSVLRRLPTLTLALALAGGTLECAVRAAGTPELRPTQVIETPVEGTRRDKVPVVNAVALSPDGATLATAGDDHLIRLWNAADGTLKQTLRGHSDWVQRVAFSPGGDLLASAGNDRRIHLWNAETGQLIKTLSRHPAAIYSLTFSPDGTKLATAGFEKVVRLYDVDRGLVLHELTCSCADNRSLVFSPDGEQLLVGGRGGCISFWTLTDGSLDRSLTLQTQRIRGLAFSPDATRIAVAGEGIEIDILDAATGEKVLTLPGRPGKTLAMAFCGNDTLATAGSDDQIHLWDLTSGQESARGMGHTGSVAALSCDAVGGRLVSGSFDTTICVWTLPDRSVRAMLERPEPRYSPR